MRGILDFIVRIIYFVFNLVYYILNFITTVMFNGCTIITVVGVVIKLFVRPELAWTDVFKITVAMLIIGVVSWMVNLVIGTIKAALENYMRYN